MKYMTVLCVFLLAGVILISSANSGSYRMMTLLDDDTRPSEENSAWKEAARIEAGEERIVSLAYYPDGRSMAIGDSVSSVMRLDLANKKVIFRTKIFEKDALDIREVAVSPDGRFIAARSENEAVDQPLDLVLMNAQTGAVVQRIKQKTFLATCEDTNLRPFVFAFSADSRFLYVLFLNEMLANKGSCLVFKDHWLVSLDLSKKAIAWKYNIPNRGLPKPDDPFPPDFCGQLPSFGQSPDGVRLVVGSCDGSIASLDPKTGRELFVTRSPYFLRSKLSIEGGIAAIGYAFSPKEPGKIFVAVADSSPTLVYLVDSAVKDYTQVITGLNESMATLGISPDGRYLGLGTKALYIWDMSNGKPVLGGCWNTISYQFKFNPVYQEAATAYYKEVILYRLDASGQSRWGR